MLQEIKNRPENDSNPDMGKRENKFSNLFAPQTYTAAAKELSIQLTSINLFPQSSQRGFSFPHSYFPLILSRIISLTHFDKLTHIFLLLTSFFKLVHICKLCAILIGC